MTPAVTVRLAPRPLEAVDADAFVVPVFSDDDLADLGPLEQATGQDLARALSAGECRTKLGETYTTGAGGMATRRVLAVGAGERAGCDTGRLRQVATAGALAARARGMGRLAFVVRGGGEPAFVQAATEGLLLAAFDGDTFKTTARETAALTDLQVVVSRNDGAAAAALDRGRVLGECCNRARAWANEPANVLTPRELGDRAAQVAAEVGLGVDVLDETRIAGLGMGLLLGVAQGSAQPPRLVVLRHDPTGAPSSPVLGLVGKGITFDTGGISIKPADGMERMKDDMAGGAAVVAAMEAIARLRAPIRVVAVVPVTENMPGGRATRPGDVLRAASGTTVEVNNTDAEGRLILADALWHARQLGATHLVDVATLTGACVVALGRFVSGLFGTPDAWRDVVAETARRAGDRVWPMPLDDDYAEVLKSEIADLVNTGGRPAGAVTAAMFLKAFTGGVPWAHLDIAGTAWADEAKAWQPKGPCPVAVRTLAELAFSADRWP